MNNGNVFGLTDDEIDFLRVAVNTNNDSDEWLAKLTKRKPSGVNSMCRDICWKLREEGVDVHDRGCAILAVLRLGIVPIDPAQYVECTAEDFAKLKRERKK